MERASAEHGLSLYAMAATGDCVHSRDPWRICLAHIQACDMRCWRIVGGRERRV